MAMSSFFIFLKRFFGIRCLTMALYSVCVRIRNFLCTKRTCAICITWRNEKKYLTAAAEVSQNERDGCAISNNQMKIRFDAFKKANQWWLFELIDEDLMLCVSRFSRFHYHHRNPNHSITVLFRALANLISWALARYNIYLLRNFNWSVRKPVTSKCDKAHRGRLIEDGHILCKHTETHTGTLNLCTPFTIFEKANSTVIHSWSAFLDG